MGREEIVGFGRDVLGVHDVEEAKERALPHILAACNAAGGAMLRIVGDDLVITHQRGLDDALGASVPLRSNVLYAEAVRTQREVRRELTREDFEGAPHLAANGMRFGMVVPVVLEDITCATAAFTRGRNFTDDEALTLRGGAMFLAAAVQRITTERHLAEREAALRLVFQQMPAIVWTTDENLVFTMIQGGTIPGLPERRVPTVGSTLAEALGPEGAPVIELMQRVLAGAHERYTYQYHGVWFDVRVQPFRDASGAIRGTVAVAFDITERHRAEETSRELAARITGIEESERRRIAREIHDDMGQRLTAMRFELDLLRRETGGAGMEHINAMKQLIHESADAVRRISSDLRPALLDDFGFRAALENAVASFERRTGIAGDLVLPAHDPPLDRNALAALYRIAQEALTNVARHAQARNVRLVVTVSDDAVHLEITDDGRGISPAEANQTTTHGLVGIRERALAFGGSVVIEARPEGGTRVAARIPRRGQVLQRS